MARKCARIFVLGHYLFLKAHSFPRVTLSENCSLLGTDNAHAQISQHIFAPNGSYCLYISSPCSPDLSLIFKMAAMLQIPCVSCLASARAVQCPCPGPNIGDKSLQIPRYSPVCPRGHPPGMAADKCIRLFDSFNIFFAFPFPPFLFFLLQ